jgi:hypothetical protein
MNKFDQVPPEKSSRRSADFKLTAVLAMALSFSACFEKARTWSGEQLKAFQRENPKAEQVDKAKVETIVSTIANFEESVRKGGSKTIEMRERDGDLVYEATLVNADTVLVEEVDEEDLEEMMKGNIGEVFMTDTVYGVIKDPETGRVTISVKQGSSMYKDGQKVVRETAIDRDTGIVEYVTYDPGFVDDEEGFALEDDGKGNLRVHAGSKYLRLTPGLGQGIGDDGDQQMRDIAKKLAAATIGAHESGGH